MLIIPSELMKLVLGRLQILRGHLQVSLWVFLGGVMTGLVRKPRSEVQAPFIAFCWLFSRVDLMLQATCLVASGWQPVRRKTWS